MLPKGGIRFGHVRVHLEGLSLAKAPRLDEVFIEGGPLHVAQEESGEIVPVGSGELTVLVRSDSIAQFLESQGAGGLSNFQVSVSQEGVRVQAVKTVLIPIQAVALVKLEVENGADVHVRLVTAEALGVGVRTLIEDQLAKINPIFQASDLPFPCVLTGVVHEAGQVRIEGRLGKE